MQRYRLEISSTEYFYLQRHDAYCLTHDLYSTHQGHGNVVFSPPLSLSHTHTLSLSQRYPIQDLDQLTDSRNLLCACPTSQMNFGFPANWLQWWRKGVQQVIGTDAGCCNDTMDVQSELRLLGNASMFSATFSPDMHKSFSKVGDDQNVSLFFFLFF